MMVAVVMAVVRIVVVMTVSNHFDRALKNISKCKTISQACYAKRLHQTSAIFV